MLSGAGAGGEGMGRGTSQDFCRGGGARRTSSVPPRQRNGMEARADPEEMRHLSAGEEQGVERALVRDPTLLFHRSS